MDELKWMCKFWTCRVEIVNIEDFELEDVLFIPKFGFE
jgi:hypothetical protein